MNTTENISGTVKIAKLSPLLILLFGILSSCSGTDTKHVEQAAKQWKTQSLQTKDITIYKEYSTYLEGCQDVEIRPQISGLITNVAVTEGQYVRKGQTLFELDNVRHEAALREAAAKVSAADAALSIAKRTYENKKLLSDKNIISQHEMMSALDELKSAQANLEISNAERLSASNMLSFTVIKSPADGIVGVLPYKQGALVGPDISTPLTTISDNSDIHAFFSVSENEFLRLIQEFGSMDSVTRHMDSVDLKLNDGSIYPLRGCVESAAGVINRSTGSVLMRALFSNPERILHSGMTANIRIPLYMSGIIVIPQSATIRLQDKTIAYKLVDGVAESTVINVIPSDNGNDYIVLNGLDEGDEIVIDGVGLLKDGHRIR